MKHMILITWRITAHLNNENSAQCNVLLSVCWQWVHIYYLSWLLKSPILLYRKLPHQKRDRILPEVHSDIGQLHLTCKITIRRLILLDKQNTTHAQSHILLLLRTTRIVSQLLLVSVWCCMNVFVCLSLGQSWSKFF